MSDPLPAYPDEEEVVLELLRPLSEVGTFRPDDLVDRMPFQLVYRFAGADDGITDRPIIGVDTFAGTRAVGKPLANATRQLLIAAPHVVTVGAAVHVIDTVRTAEGPHEVPYGDSMVRRWVASYFVTLRR